MLIKSAEFICSSSRVEQCPKTHFPEFAMIGRSNVGKSSLINMLVNNKNLAKTSSTPGKTQLINHFLVDKSWYLVDLPGYGYAKRSKSLREEWEKMIHNYLFKRQNLLCTMVLIDSSIPPQKIDLEFVHFLGKQGFPIAVVFTKTDKLKKKPNASYTQDFQDTMLESWEDLPPILYTSVKKKEGKEEILDFFEKAKELWKQQ
jgi:GTP-binding protein